MDSESLALASTAAATLVTSLTTDAWTWASREIVSMWHRFLPAQAADVAAELAQARADALAGDQAVIRAVTAEWEGRLGRLLTAHAEAKADLARVTDTLAGAGLLAKTSAGPAGNVTITQHVDATGERAVVIQAGRDARIGDLGKMVLGARPVHLQQITATDASVVIQVGRDLYVSDPALTALWAPGGTTPGECPYPGLDAFGPGQASWFFGREKVTGDLLEMLDDALRDGCGGPVTVVGPSGAGKSSLLGAGLLGGLADGRLPAAGSDSWPRLVITPGAHPSRILREALRACAQARGDGAAARTVVVVDQLEEVFTACDDEAERAEFLAALADLAAPRSQDGPAALVVLGLRADFFARATAYPVLRSALASRQIVLGAMSPAELRQAITLPARTVGLTLDGGLVERLLGDLGVDETAGYEPGRLPLLGHALRATWQRRDGDRLTIAGYEAAGGIGGAIAKTADDVYARLDEAGQSAARQVFLGLVRIGESGEPDGEGIADTRRRVSAESLCAGSADPDAARAALDAFIAARLLTSGGHTVEISHDALLRRWPRLRDWISEDRTGHLVRQGLEEAAATWDREGREGSGLYSGIRLATAGAWAEDPGHRAELSRVARDFLAAAARRRRRTARRRNALVAAAVALALVLAGLAGYAVQLRATNAAEGMATESGVLTSQVPDATALDDLGTAMEFAVEAQRLDPVSAQARSALLSTQALPFAGHLAAGGAGVLGVAYSPDGTVIATAGGDGFVRLWSAASYGQLAKVRLQDKSARGAAVNAVAFSPDGHLLAAASAQGEVSLWNVIHPSRPVSAGILRPGARDTGRDAIAMAISPDGQTLAVGYNNGSLVLWSLPRRTLEGTVATGRYINSLAFLPGGRTLATASDAVRLWDVATLRLTATLPAAGLTLGQLAVSPDGQTIAYGGPLITSGPAIGTATVELWSVPGRRLLKTTFTIPDSFVSALAFSPDGGLLAVGDIDGKLRLYDPREGYLLLATINGQRQTVSQVAFSPDGTRVATASDGGVALWNARSNTLGSPDPSLNVAFSLDGHLLAVATQLRVGSGVALYRMPAGKLIATLPTGDTSVNGLAFSPDGRMLAAGLDSSPAAVQLWNTGSLRMTGQIGTGQAKGLMSLAFSPDGRTLATATAEDKTVRLWSVTGLTRVATFSTGQIFLGVWAVAFSPDGRSLAVANVLGLTQVFSIPGGVVTRSFQDQGDAVAFSPDGRTLAVGSVDGNVYLYPVRGAAGPTRILAQSTQTVKAVAFTPDGRTLIAAGFDATIRLWDTATRALTAAITTDARGIEAVSYSGSLHMIATTDGAVTRVWRIDPTAVAAGVCATLKAPLTTAEWSTYLPEYPFSPVC